MEYKYKKASKFNYTEPSVGVAGRLHCNECKHTLNELGHRPYGIVKTLKLGDLDFGKLVCYCDKQEAFVKPYAWCDKVEKGLANFLGRSISTVVVDDLEDFKKDECDAVPENGSQRKLEDNK